MNYLAHLYLADCSGTDLLGNLMGDFVKGNHHQDYPEAIRQGVWLHRQIDKFTDAHAVVRASRERINKQRRRYSGVLVDMFYDHFLACNWQQYSDLGFEEQLRQWIGVLRQDQSISIPQRMQPMLEGITRGGMLQSYQSQQGIEYALWRISQRIRFQNQLDRGIEDLDQAYRELEQDFKQFFPDLIRFTKGLVGGV